MKRGFIYLLSFLLVFMFLVRSVPLNASAKSLYVRKIVSVVYDDSGSMSYDSANWAYANYAMQAFCGLMNSEDRLFITYMSKAESDPSADPVEIDLSSGQIQHSVDGIRSHADAGNTPFSAVDIAFNKLLETQDAEDNTEYWLVILTDGAFQDNYGYSVSDADLDHKMKSIISAQMPNGSHAQVSYFAIGKKAPKPTENKADGIYVYDSKGAKDIVNVMAEIANRVSGRSLLSTKEIKKKGADTIEIDSSLPLLNIAVLSQSSDIEIAEISYVDGSALNVERSVSIRYPELYDWKTDESLKGGVFLIGNQGRNISAGSYSIRFTGSVNLKNLVIMFEPALELRMGVILNGTEMEGLSDLNELHEGDRIDFFCRLYEIGSGNEVPFSLLPSDTEFSMVLLENGSPVLENQTSDMTLSDIELRNQLTEVTAEVNIQGSGSIRLTTGKFTPGRPVVYSIGIEKPEDFSMTVDELRTNTDSIRFVIYENGLPLPAERVEKMSFSIETEMPGKIVHEPDGAISFTPLYRDPISTLPTGTVEVTGILNGITSVTTSLYIKPIEYEVKAVGADADSILRSELGSNGKGVRFMLYADGKALGRSAAEAAALEIRVKAPYDRRLVYLQEVDADGMIRLIPRYEKWSWLIPYFVPTGNWEITVSFNGGEGSGGMEITRDFWRELIINWIVPLLILAFIVGHLVKKRFAYTDQIAYNTASGSGMYVSGPVTGWQSESLLSLSIIAPFAPDCKTINGVRFYAGGRFGNRRSICVKTGKTSPPVFGTIDANLSEMQAVRFRRADAMPLGSSQTKLLLPGNAIVCGDDANFSVCRVYLYVNN